MLTAGTYRAFSIRLKSNVALYLDQGATILAASPNDGDGKYDLPEPNPWDQYQDFDYSRPSYGFFIRHVKGLQMRDVELSYLSPDLRPAFWLNDVAGAEFIHVKAQRETDVPVFVLKSVSDFILQQSWPLPDQRLERVEMRKF